MGELRKNKNWRAVVDVGEEVLRDSKGTIRRRRQRSRGGLKRRWERQSRW